jgi:hypothetical protein
VIELIGLEFKAEWYEVHDIYSSNNMISNTVRNNGPQRHRYSMGAMRCNAKTLLTIQSKPLIEVWTAL